MRMWNCDPQILCRKHLLGEHSEIHKFRHNFVKKHNMSKRVLLNQITPGTMSFRHDLLAKELLNRSYKHESPYELPDLDYLGSAVLTHPFNFERALQDLLDRCPECKQRYLEKVLNNE